MTDSNYSNYRPEVDLAADKIDEYLKELEERNAQRQAVEQEATEKEDQALAQQEDPRNSETWGAKAFIKEGSVHLIRWFTRHCILYRNLS